MSSSKLFWLRFIVHEEARITHCYMIGEKSHGTGASDDHQSSAGAPSENDMDVAADNDDENEEDCMWVLPEVEIPDKPKSRKCTYTHRIT